MRIQVIVNPAAGRPQPILHTLNTVLHPAGVLWDVAVTQQSGDAEHLARAAAQAGADIVAVYGGDGTVMEVAQGLLDSETPLAILPGGTANLMSVELGIPRDLAAAARLMIDPNSIVRQVDMGKVGERYFMLRVGVGFAAQKVADTSREMKDRYGVAAYTLGSLKALATAERITFEVEIDGQTHIREGLTLIIDNAGNMGLPNFKPARSIDVSDGLLDVVVGSLQPGLADGLVFSHASGKRISVKATPAQLTQGDGELWGETPLIASVVPGAMRVLVAP